VWFCGTGAKRTRQNGEPGKGRSTYSSTLTLGPSTVTPHCDVALGCGRVDVLQTALEEKKCPIIEGPQGKARLQNILFPSVRSPPVVSLDRIRHGCAVETCRRPTSACWRRGFGDDGGRSDS